MVLGDVVEVVRDRTADEFFSVIPEQLQQFEHRLRVLLEPAQPRSPREARAGSFRHQPADVHVAVRCPKAQAGKRFLGKAVEVGADAELGGETFG